jgi:hypothetical protein
MAVSKCERTGNNGTGRRASYQIEPIPEPYVGAHMLAKKFFDAFEKSNRYRPTHSPAIERKYPLRPSTE